MEEQGQPATRRISQHDQYTPIRVRPPPRFTIPYQEGWSWHTDDRVYYWIKNFPQHLVRHWIGCQYNVQGNVWILIWWWTFVPYIYAITDGRPINSISRRNSQTCHGKNTWSVCPSRLRGSRHGWRIRWCSSTQPTQSSMLDLDKSTSNSLEKRYAVILIVKPLMNSPRRPALGGDVDHPVAKRVNSQRVDGKKMKNLKKLWKMNILRLSQAHRPSRYGKRRWHHHQRYVTRCVAI